MDSPFVVHDSLNTQYSTYAIKNQLLTCFFLFKSLLYQKNNKAIIIMDINEFYKNLCIVFLVGFLIFTIYCLLYSTKNTTKSAAIFFRGVMVTFFLLVFMGFFAFKISNQNIENSISQLKVEEQKNIEKEKNVERSKVFKEKYSWR